MNDRWHAQKTRKLDSQIPARGERLQCVLKSRTVENLEGQLTHRPQRYPPRSACPKADDQRLNASNSFLLNGIQLSRFFDGGDQSDGLL